MEVTATRTHTDVSPVMHYWGLVKNMDDKLKLELVSMLISSLRLRPATNEEEREHGFPLGRICNPTAVNISI